MIKPRESLAIGAELALSGTIYKITDVLGSGSNAICYRAAYDDSSLVDKQHSCLIKELFPLHDRDLIRRDDAGSIYVDPEVKSAFELHKRSFLRGCTVGIDLNEERPDKSMPMLNTHEANGTVYALIGVSGGESLKSKNIRTLKAAAEITIAVLHALRPFHSAELWHLDVSPDNILLMPRDKGEKTNRILLIDYNSVFSSKEITDESGVYFSVKNPFTAPEIKLGDLRHIGASTDLYSVAAVFARLIFHDFSGNLPEIRPTLPIFENVPQTAIHKAISIVRRGLRLSSCNRYQTIDELLVDLQELLNRIDSVGVTLPALWEASSIQYKSVIALNPQFAYVSSNNIPSQLSASDIKANTLITGDGGIGKTTALLRIWQSGIEKYNPNAPVPLYIKLDDYSREKSIRIRCLERMRFSAETSTVADALKSLDTVFDKPNSVLLLLDGFNEVADNQRESLLSEIVDLRKSGVRIVLSSRSNVNELTDFYCVKLSPLISDFVRDYLKANRLLYPDGEGLHALLTNPMMLTMYVTVVSNSNTQTDSFDETALIKAYLDYAMLKANSAKAAEFAVNVILPPIAAVMAKQKSHAVTGTQLLDCVERIYKDLKSKHFYKEFPEYIGESSALLCEAESAEEWFGVIINKLIGRELALLVKTESGQFTFVHQLYRDYFIGIGGNVSGKFIKIAFRRSLPKMVLFAFVAAFVIFGIWGVSYYTGIRESNVFPKTDEEIKVVNEAITVLQLATGNFNASLYDGYSMIDSFKAPPQTFNDVSEIEHWLSGTETRLADIQKKAIQSYVMDSSRIDKTITKIPDRTLSTNTFRELCEFSSDFSEQRNKLLNGIYNKWLTLEANSPRLMEMFAKYEEWADNKVYEYVLLLRYTINILPDEYQSNLLDMKGLTSPFPQLLRDKSFDINAYESDLNHTHDIDTELQTFFRTEGILS